MITDLAERGSNAWECLSKASFDIGGDDQLASLRAKYPEKPVDEQAQRKLVADWEALLTNTRIRIGTLLKADAVSFLLGAGTSKECGGVLIGTIPLEVERELVNEGIIGDENRRVRSWLKHFYLAVARAGVDVSGLPTTRDEIIQRSESVKTGNATPLQVNYETLLSLLHRWRSVLPLQGGRLRIDGTPPIDLHSDDIDECLRRATVALARRCRLPADGTDPNAMHVHKEFLRKILTRPLNLKRANIFTLNYDTLVEQAADAEGVVLVDGFVGTVRRIFRPESYDQDLYFPAETTEGRVHRLDRVIHLYKLHGSITWAAEEPKWDNPYGVVAGCDIASEDSQVLIYPTPAKFGEMLGMPYAELFRRFAAAVVRPQSTLFVLGYSFGDDHVKAIIRQALAIPSFTLVIVDPEPKGDFVARLEKQKDRRVWIFRGATFGTFSGFVKHILPDLRDEDIQRKVMATHRALAPQRGTLDGEEPADG